MALITVTGTLKDIFGVAVPAGGSVTLQLCNYGSTLPRVAGTALVARQGQVEVDVDGAGAFSVVLFGNDTITPAGTYYTVTVRDDNGDVVQTEAYQLNGAGPYDLSTLAPFAI